MKQPFILLLLITFCQLGCGNGGEIPQEQPVGATASEIAAVYRIVSELHNIPISELNGDVKLSDLSTPMDDLDIVELVMELEERFGVQISDELLVATAGNDGINVLPKHLTLNSIAQMLHDVRSRSTNAPETSDSDDWLNDRKIVALTPEALAKVRESLGKSGRPYLRVSVEQGASTGFIYEMRFEDRLETDKDYLDESHGITIVVDRKSALFIEGTVIDWQVTDDGGEGFYFDNPNAVKR